MDQFWAPNWPPKSLKSASQVHSDFRTRCSKNLLVPRRPQDGSRWPRGAQDSPKLAPKSSQDSPKMGQIGLRWGKIAQRFFQKLPNKAFPLPFLSFPLPFLCLCFPTEWGGFLELYLPLREYHDFMGPLRQWLNCWVPSLWKA